MAGPIARVRAFLGGAGAGIGDEREAFDAQEQRRRAEHLARYAEAASQAGAGLGRRFPRVARTVVVPGSVLARRTAIDDLSTHAGALTYAAVLSIPALLLFSVSVAGFVLAGNASAQEAVVSGIVKFLPGSFATSAQTFLTDQLDAAIAGRLSFGLLGLAGLLWTASGLASRMRLALGRIFGTGRPGLILGRFRGMVLGMIMVLALLGFAAASIVQGWFSFSPNDLLARIGSVIGMLAGVFVFFLVLYRALTPHGPGLRGHVPGAVTFAVGFEALAALGGFYFSRIVADATAVYGALGSLFGVIAFLYATAWLLLASAELSAFLWDRVRTREPRASATSEHEPSPASSG